MKPIPPFTPEAFRRTIERAKNATISDRHKNAVDELRNTINHQR